MGFVQNGIVFFSDFFDNNYEERVFAMDTTGVELWSRQAETFLISMEPTNNKNLLVVEDSRMYLLNSQGQAIWSKTDEFFYGAVYMGNTSFISYQDQTISSLNLSDGSLRWIHSIDPFGYVFDIDVSDDGKVVVVTDEGILIFDE